MATEPNPLNALINQVTSTPPLQSSNEERMFYEKHLSDLANSNQNMLERKKYAEYIFSFTCIWCICIFSILILKGLGKLALSDTIIITLIGSTTLNILVFFTLVTKYLFNSEKST
ncbi:hypothetical protein [Flavobacterium sp.]|uniref:hypothetical protein n=1 Tax=Flavobacterium sp. TaxID=239 RepID=UPI0031DF3B2D